MQLFSNLFSRQFYRQISFWFIFLLALYSAVGFWLTPYLIHKTVTEQVQSRLGWQAKVGKIEVNPYSLSLNVENFSIINQDDRDVFGFSRFYTNFTLRSIFEWAITFQSVELIEPYLDITINQDGSNNFLLALAAHAEKDINIAEEDTESGSLIPLLFDNILVDNGGISVNNKQPRTPVFHQVKPITFNLQNFSTRLNENGQYQLDIVLDSEQKFHWKGLVALNPISSSGILDVSGIRLHNFSPYFQEFVPYQLSHGLASVKGSYDFAMTEVGPELKIQQAILDISKIQVSTESQPQDFLKIENVNVGPSDFDLQAKKLVIKTIKVDKLLLDVLRDEQGQLAMLVPLLTQNKVSSSSEVSKPVASEQTEFLWQIDKIALLNSQVNWLDQQPQQAANITINDINAEVFNLNQELSSILDINTQYVIDNSQTNTVKGELIISPLSFKANAKLDAVDLRLAQPYVSEVAQVNLRKGTLFADLNVHVRADPQQQLLTDIEGDVSIKEFNTRDKILNKRLVGWQELAIKPIKVTINPLAIDIGKIALNKPYFRMIITEERGTNIANLMIKKESKETFKEPDNTQSTAPLAINIDEISLLEGGAYFADLSLRPQFGSGIEQLNGVIQGIDSKSQTPANVKIDGRIEEYGKMVVNGKFKPFANDLYTDIDVNFDKIELTTMTPYSGRYAGYVIDKGKLSLHLNYQIEKRMLSGQNRLILDQFELGKTVDSEEAVNLPIKLALALFKDKNGVIDINLPTSGNMDSPDFKISGLVLQALTNVITKAVTSPFSVLSGIVDGDPEQLNSVAFALGKSNLSDDQKANLKTLAEILVNRPQLVLEMRVMIDKDAESEILKAQHLQQELLESGVDINDAEHKLTAMQNLFIERANKSSLEELQKQVKTSIANEQSTSAVKLTPKQLDNLYQQQYQTLLYQQLLDKQPLASLELLNLAKKRIGIIKKELITINNVPNTQIYALNPSLQGKAEDEKVLSEFTLTSE